jgi:hypothetical protein
MTSDTFRRLTCLAVCVAVFTTAAACGGQDDEHATATTNASTEAGATSPASSSTSAPATRHAPTPSTEPVERVAPTTSVAPSTSAALATTPPVDDEWREEAATVCAAYASALPSVPRPEAVGWIESVAAWRGLRDRLPSFDAIDYPAELQTSPFDVLAVMREADRLLAAAERSAADGDGAGADASLSGYLALLEHSAALVTVAGAECPPADPARAANADLNVPVPGIHQASMGFGSVWASPQASGTTITRVDPTDGAIIATIDIGAPPFRGHPADGRMIFRTADAFVAVDPITNTVVATLPKSDVGPAANRQWSVDGALWICDGQRLHRYDPSTFTPTGSVVDLGVDCGAVVAGEDLVVAWNYNEVPGESGESTAVFIDPATDEVLATTPLPADATFPLILDDAVFFPANLGTTNAVVDRTTWTVTATPDYGRTIGNTPASDGRAIYLIADESDVLVLDADSYELTDVIEPLRVYDHPNAVAVSPGALWVATGDTGILQRFDVA